MPELLLRGRYQVRAGRSIPLVCVIRLMDTALWGIELPARHAILHD
jgi:hypothetical protein